MRPLPRWEDVISSSSSCETVEAYTYLESAAGAHAACERQCSRAVIAVQGLLAPFGVMGDAGATPPPLESKTRLRKPPSLEVKVLSGAFAGEKGKLLKPTWTLEPEIKYRVEITFKGKDGAEKKVFKNLPGTDIDFVSELCL